MIKSKGWDWNMNFADKESLWKTPVMESYGLLNRWLNQGKKTFLDLGCGMGRHSLLFGLNEFKVFCFDISKEAIEKTREWAEEENLQFDYRIGDMISLPYADESFDCLLAWNTVSHTDTEGVRKSISEIKRVLRKDGEAYLTFGSKDTWGFKQDWMVVDENTRLRMEEGPEYLVPHFYADKDLLEELFADFDVISLTHVEDWGNNNRGIHYHIHVSKR